MEDMLEPDQQSQQQQPAVPPKSNDGRKKAIVGVVLLAVILIGAGLWAATKDNKTAPKQTTTSASPVVVAPADVSITKDGFVPATISVRVGQSVSWTNQDDAMHQVAADPHPSHSSLPGLVGESLSKGESYSFVFEKAGTYTYHDELNPLKLQGTVIVQ